MHHTKFSLFVFSCILMVCVAADAVAAMAPVITSIAVASGKVGSSFSFQITATNRPRSYGATGLPPGLAINTGTGLISGTPTVAGTSAVTLKAANRSGTGDANLTLSILPTSSIAAVLSLSSSSLLFASQTVGTASPAQIITLNDTGNAALGITSIALSGANAGDFAQTNNCGSSVAAGNNCAINVTFTPAASGSWAASLTISHSAAGSPQTLALSGAGTSASGSATLSPTSLAFSSQPIDIASSAQTVTLTNGGTNTLSISSFAVTGTNSSDFVQNNTCGTLVAAAATCAIVVLFTPSIAGAETAALSISDNATGSPQSVSLSGTGSHDVILSWTASTTSGVTGYNVYRGTTSGGESSTALNSAPTSGTTYTDANLTAGVEYYYRVTSVISTGATQSSASNEASATVP